jgi:hypothetical protein
MPDSEEAPTPYNWEKFLFERMAWGWIFRSPVCWWPLWLGPGRYYLLNDAQKAEIVRAMRAVWRRWTLRLTALLLGAVPLFVLSWKTIPLWADYGLPLELSMVALVLLFALWAQIILNVLYGRALRPFLAGALPIKVRMSVALIDQVRAHADTSSVATWIFGGLVFAAAFAVAGHDRLVAKTSPLFSGSISLVLIGLGVVFFFAMAAIKLKAQRLNP